jgi:hypothetical protein
MACGRSPALGEDDARRGAAPAARGEAVSRPPEEDVARRKWVGTAGPAVAVSGSSASGSKGCCRHEWPRSVEARRGGCEGARRAEGHQQGSTRSLGLATVRPRTTRSLRMAGRAKHRHRGVCRRRRRPCRRCRRRDPRTRRDAEVAANGRNSVTEAAVTARPAGRRPNGRGAAGVSPGVGHGSASFRSFPAGAPFPRRGSRVVAARSTSRGSRALWIGLSPLRRPVNDTQMAGPTPSSGRLVTASLARRTILVQARALARDDHAWRLGRLGQTDARRPPDRRSARLPSYRAGRRATGRGRLRRPAVHVPPIRTSPDRADA